MWCQFILRTENFFYDCLFQGPDAIIRVCRSILSNLYEQKHFDRKVRSKYASTVKGVERLLQQHFDEKIVTLSWLHKMLVTASNGQLFSSLSETGLGTILHWLSVQVSAMPTSNSTWMSVVITVSFSRCVWSSRLDGWQSDVFFSLAKFVAFCCIGFSNSAKPVFVTRLPKTSYFQWATLTCLHEVSLKCFASCLSG